MILLAFQPWYLLIMLLIFGLAFSITGMVFIIRRKTMPGLLLAFIGLACILLFLFAAFTNPDQLPFLN
jgi:hypothetical protein